MLHLLLRHSTSAIVMCRCMCDDLVVYASACVLRSKITCADKLDYSEEEVHSILLPGCAQRQDIGQDVWSQIWMQWMTITSFVSCYALHVPQHAAVLLFGQLDLIKSRFRSPHLLKQSLHIWTRHIKTHRFQF